MKALSVARKTLIESWREPIWVGLIFAFPVMMLVFYEIAFGGTNQGLAKFLKLVVVNQEAGAPVDGKAYGDELVKALEGLEFEGQPVFQISPAADLQAAQTALWERKVALVMVIPPDFTRRLTSPAAAQNGPAVIQLVGDTASDNFVFARSFLEGLVGEFTRKARGMPASQAIHYEFILGTGTMSDFDAGVPGVIVFGIMLLVPSTAMVMVRENVSGTLRRLRLTRLKARDLFLGVTAAHMAIALILVPFTFGVALAFGFRSHGSLLLAVGVCLLLSLAAVGIGLVVACFARTDSEAANLGAGIAVPLVLASGAMGPLPAAPVVMIAGTTIQAYDFLPTVHAINAMTRVLILGDSLSAIAYQLFALAFLCTLILITGVLLYQRLQLKKA